ncbi:MAG: hypothetical protein ACK5PB_03175 [Pirellula sp.]|jgi:translocation and assembly module TamB
MKTEDSDFGKRRSKKRRIGRFVILTVVVLVVVSLLGIPLAIQNRGLVLSLANKHAGISPLRIDLTSVEAGWLSPVRIRDLRLIDGNGAELVRIGELETELTLINLITNYRNLKKVTVKGAEIQVQVLPGTTNLEQAIQPLLAGDAPADPSPATSAGTMTSFTGRIVVADAVIHATDSVDQTSWDLVLNQVDFPIPTANQPIPPMTLLGTLRQTKAHPGEVLMGGQFQIRTEPLAQSGPQSTNSLIGPTKMSISTTGLPLNWVSLAKRRLPDLPVDHLSGLATVQSELEVHNNQSFFARIHTAQIDALRLVAPSLVGAKGASMEQIRLTGNIQSMNSRIKADGLILQTDVGAVTASADLPLTFSIPTISEPWLANAEYDIEGNIDIARVVAVAPDLIPVQDQVQLNAGRANLQAVQRLSSNLTLPPTSTIKLGLGGLKANVNGRQMNWDEAFSAIVNIASTPTGQPSLKLDCTSEFGSIKGEGDLIRGNIAGNFDLELMHNRLSQWVALPMQQVKGSAECNITWLQDEGNRLVTTGGIRTTPISIRSANGELKEPKWDGTFQMVTRLDRGQLIQIDRANLELKAKDELLSAVVMEPVSLVPAAPGTAGVPPAGLQLKLVGDLAGWQRRGQLLAGIDLGVLMGGQCNLDARGIVDVSAVEIQDASLDVKSLQVKSGDTNFAEPQLIATFKGAVNSNDITKLKIDNLLIQTLSFALQAKDDADAEKAFGRIGQAAYRINPKQLVESLGMAQGPDAISVDGDVTGTAQWRLDSELIQWGLNSKGSAIQVFQNLANNGAILVSTTDQNNGPPRSQLWSEPQAELIAEGTYELAKGLLSVTKAQVMTEWFAYGGNASVLQANNQTKLISKGQVVYDAAKVAEKIKPWTGSYLAIRGRKTQPLEIQWTSNDSGIGTWAEALQASSQVGWDDANVLGIPVGPADIPIVVKNGHLLTQADIPVSQGRLRWNLDGDIGSSPIKIVQQPQTIIDNVAITPQMCQGWLRFVAPMLADVTSIQGNLSLKIDEAVLVPTSLMNQTAKGQLVVHGANVGPGPLADQLIGIVQQVRNFKRGLGAAEPNQAANWLHMPQQDINFDVQQGRVMHRDMKFQAGEVTLTTNGSVGIDGSLELNASVPIQAEWLEKVNSLSSLAGQPIVIPIRGTIQKPQLDYSGLTSLAQQVATTAIRGEAQKQIDKGLNKLLGPLSNQLQPFQQGMQQMQQGVQNNLPQLPNLPIPGFGGNLPFGTNAAPPQQPPVPPK